MFDPIAQIAGFFVAITFMSLPAVAVSSLPVAAFLLMRLMLATGTPEKPALAASGVQVTEEQGSGRRH